MSEEADLRPGPADEELLEIQRYRWIRLRRTIIMTLFNLGDHLEALCQQLQAMGYAATAEGLMAYLGDTLSPRLQLYRGFPSDPPNAITLADGHMITIEELPDPVRYFLYQSSPSHPAGGFLIKPQRTGH